MRLQGALQLLLGPRQYSHHKGLLLLLGAWLPLGPHLHSHDDRKGLLPLGTEAEEATECATGTGLCA